MTEGAGTLRAALAEAAAAVRSRSALEPEVGIILGTGLGRLAGEIRVSAALQYEEIPHFPASTVESHAGRLLLGELSGCRVVAMDGRFHRYEGRTVQELALPVRVMHALGARTLVVSNAAGALNPLWEPGELALLDDHINLLGDNPLIGPNLDELGPRFPDMSEPYDRQLQAAAEAAALELRIPLRRGVYAAVSGPTLETRAEYRMLRMMGADMVGMSTVPEVIAARHAGMRVLGVSVLTDRCLPDALEPMTLESIIAVADAASPALTALVSRVVGGAAVGRTDAGCRA
ncbi:MAG TPA: purine-nucleoside phosphorylase [Longimicrobiales bacterium]|nr:purine-nucleoside phosphorylase [Longimicrobiales bacterium]